MSPWSRTSRFALVFAGAITIPLSASATCHHPKCSVDLNSADNTTVPVIVQYANDPSDAEFSAVHSFGPVSHRIHSIHAISAKVSASDLETLANRPGVAFVSLDRKVAVSQAAVAPIGTTPEFTAEPINATWANAKGYTGKGIGVAVIDSGISAVDDLAGHIVYSQNFVPNETTTTDGYGHGTHVAGLIAGSGKDSTGTNYTRTFGGIAPAPWRVPAAEQALLGASPGEAASNAAANAVLADAQGHGHNDFKLTLTRRTLGAVLTSATRA